MFALVAAESLGIPLPGETALINAAAHARHTHLSPWIIFAVASPGALTIAAALLLILRRHAGKLALRAEDAYPGPLT